MHYSTEDISFVFIIEKSPPGVRPRYEPVTYLTAGRHRLTLSYATPQLAMLHPIAHS
jgi:hypothetical protein